ncbi:MAG: hypothetical protein K1X82_00835 [Bacteroidia bacterium]|nr:hypothetical protein [Bacteroidia bacterium]
MELIWGENFRIPKKHFQLDFTGNPDDGYVNICWRNKKSIALQHFDKNLKFKKEEIISNKEKKGSIFEGTVKLNGRFFIRQVRRDKKANKSYCIVQEVDVKSGKLLAEKVLCEGEYRSSNFYYKSSKDKDYFMVYFTKPKESRRDSKNFETYCFRVFDMNLNKKWGKDVRLPYPESEIRAQEFTLTSKGEVYMLMKKHQDNGGKKLKGSKDTDLDGKASSNFGLELYKVDPNDFEMDKIKVKFNPKYYYSTVKFFETDVNQLLLISLYSSAKNDSYDGLSLMTFNPEAGEFEESQLYEIPTELIKEFESAKENRKRDKKAKKKGDNDEEAASLELRSAILDKDGNLYITAEQYYLVITSHTHTDGKGGSYTTYTYHHYFQDVYVFKINKEKSLEWVKKIPKNQASVNTTRTMGIHSMVYNGDYYLVYFDNTDNLKLSGSKSPSVYGPGKGMLCYSKINSEGKVPKEKLFDIKEEEKYLEVTDFERVAEGTYLTTAYFKKDKNPVILRVKD